jgi:hypothetical protein
MSGKIIPFKKPDSPEARIKALLGKINALLEELAKLRAEGRKTD